MTEKEFTTTQKAKSITNNSIGVLHGNVNIYTAAINGENIVNTSNAPLPASLRSISRKHYITDEAKSRYILSENLDKKAEVENCPDKFYIMTFYFITLKYDNEYYVLLDYGSYPEHEYNDFWTIPRTVTLLKGVHVKKVGEILEQYNRAAKDDSVKKRLEHLNTNFYYIYGIFDGDEDTVDHHVEYKHAVTDPNNWRCYKIVNKFISRIDSVGIRNIVDPECRHNRVFLPLSQLEKLPRVSEGFVATAPKNGWYSFMGRLIPENIVDTLIGSQDKLKLNANEITAEDLVFKSKGVLFKIAVSNSHEFFMASSDRGMIDRQVTDVFERIMLRYNIIHYALDGYQITGAISVSDRGVVDFTEILDYAYRELTRFLFRKDTKLFLRCTAMFGEYEYGKILGLYSRIPRFAGTDYERLRILSHRTHTIQMKVAPNSNGVIFAYTLDDERNIKFNSVGVREYTPTDKEGPFSLKFLIVERS